MLNLKRVDPPIDIPPFRVTRIWHRRYDADIGHRWLGDLVRKICGALNERVPEGR